MNSECRMQNDQRPRAGFTVALLLCVLHSAFCVSLPGCALIGVAANAVPQYTKAKYTGLQNQSIGVMVWADRGVLIDWETIQIDLANSIQAKLEASKADDLKGAKFAWRPASVVRYQRDHPGIEALPITDIAAQLPFTRLIYIEVESFRTRSETALELFRGSGVLTLKIIEVDPASHAAKVGYSEENIQAVYPRKAPPDGITSGNDQRIYIGTVQGLADEVVNRLVAHEDE
jgi:hypothetical protein